MSEARWERLETALGGYGAILIGAAAVVFERGPVSPTDAPADIVSYFVDNQDALLAQALLFVLGAAAFVWFAGCLRAYLGRAEGGSGRLSAVAFAAAVASNMLTLGALAFQVGLAWSAGSDAAPALVGTMLALFMIASLPLAVMLLAVAVLVFRAAAFPAWLGVLALLAAVTQLLPLAAIVLETGPLSPEGWLASYLPYPLYVVWLGATTTLMLRRPRWVK